MLLSRLRPSKKKPPTSSDDPRSIKKAQIPELDEFLLKRDYTGAISVLEHRLRAERSDITELWLAHCYFRAGDYKKASDLYETMLRRSDCPPEVNVYLACCYMYLGMYEEVLHFADLGPKNELRNRLLFHVGQRLGDEKLLMAHHKELGDDLENQLSLAAMHYARQHFDQAIDIYTRILTDHKNMIAINVYSAMCFFKKEMYEVATEMLSVYLRSYPDSPTALNLKACIICKMFTGKAALAEVEKVKQRNLAPSIKDLYRHNEVVYKDGDGALQALPSLVDAIPEARLNLIIYHLNKKTEDDVYRAITLCNEMNAVQTIEYLVKAAAYATIGVMKDQPDPLNMAKQYYKIVGDSDLLRDTIVGRQCIAASMFLDKKYDEAAVYWQSVQKYGADDDFHYNYGQALLMAGKYKQAEEEFLAITGSDRDENDHYKFMLARTYCLGHKAGLAWDIYLRTKNNNAKTAFILLRIIANDCFKTGDFYHAVKAFDALEKIDPSPENWQGKLSSVAGLFGSLATGKTNSFSETMSEIIKLLEKNNQPQAEALLVAIKMFAKRNSIPLRYRDDSY